MISIDDVIVQWYSNIRIPEVEWIAWLQDVGCTKELLVKKTYQQNKIPAYGPPDASLYFPQLAATAIDYAKNINKAKGDGKGWKRFPWNSSDVKVKIIEILLSLRRINNDGNYGGILGKHVSNKIAFYRDSSVSTAKKI